MEFLERISEHWLKWTSLPFVFGLDLTLYVFTASELNDLPNISIGWKEYLLLAIPFILLFGGYLVWCCVHNLKNKGKEQDNPTAEKTDDSKKSGSKKTVYGSGCGTGQNQTNGIVQKNTSHGIVPQEVFGYSLVRSRTMCPAIINPATLGTQLTEAGMLLLPGGGASS